MKPRLFMSPFLLLFAMPWVFAGANAQEAPQLELVTVVDDVYAIVGPLENRTPENLGNNATFGVVVTGEGVVLIDPGGTAKGAAAIERVIRRVTGKPVKVVINTGGQDHRWLGNSHFKAGGARIIASERAVTDQKTRAQDQFFVLGNLVGEDGLEGTDAAQATETFDDAMSFTLGGTTFELRHAGHAHTSGDSFVWLPDRKVVFTGDIVYVERMLAVSEFSASKTWIGAFEAIAALDPEHVVPGHGRPTDLATARADTYDYLVFLRHAVADFREQARGIENIGALDQSRFGYLENFDILAGRNAQRVYDELEWE
jgi:glyoxylase-like metal-dependent hydrolase (beta-lactamase superfamily II)